MRGGNTVSVLNLTDDEIGSFISINKRVVNKENTANIKKFKRRNIELIDNEDRKYEIFIRQHLTNDDDFSCGIRMLLDDGDNLTLLRCNGSSHSHKNQLEKNELGYKYHIHRATSRYIEDGKKRDGFAVTTDEYTNVRGAYQYLLKICNILDRSLEDTLAGIDIWR